MSTREMEKDTVERPVINPWRYTPGAGQIRYATDLCRSELPYAQRVATIASFKAMDSREMSVLIDELAEVRRRRMARLRRTLHGRRR